MTGGASGNGTAEHADASEQREASENGESRENAAQPSHQSVTETSAPPPQPPPKEPQQNPSEQPHTIAHFEPSPPLEGTGGRPSKPYVVWSSAPAEPSHDPGREEGGG